MKLTKQFVDRARKVINYDINALALTDEELIDEINEGLDKCQQITHTTYYNWLQAAKEGNSKNNNHLEELFKLIKKGRKKQKLLLIKQLQGTEKATWQRFAWLLERKYDELNLKQISKHEIDIKPIQININLELTKKKGKK